MSDDESGEASESPPHSPAPGYDGELDLTEDNNLIERILDFSTNFGRFPSPENSLELSDDVNSVGPASRLTTIGLFTQADKLTALQGMPLQRRHIWHSCLYSCIHTYGLQMHTPCFRIHMCHVHLSDHNFSLLDFLFCMHACWLTVLECFAVMVIDLYVQISRYAI